MLRALWLVLICFTACLPSFIVRPATMDGMRPILENGVDGFVREPDLTAAEAALAANMKLIESVAETYPDDPQFLSMAAMARANFAFAFIHDELEATKLAYPDEPERAAALAARATAHFRLGETYARAALMMNDDFAEIVGEGPLSDLDTDTLKAALETLEDEDLPALFWLAFNWGGRIQTTMDVEEATQLPKLELMVDTLLARDEDFFYGIGPHLLAGTLAGFRSPALGGSPDVATKHFQRAKELGGGVLLPDVMLAQFVYAQTEKQAEFERTLKNVISSSISADRALLDSLAKRKACRLYANLDQFFLDDPKPLPAGCQSVSHKIRLRAPE